MTRRVPQLDQCENWTFEAVAQRYHDYCRRYGVKWSDHSNPWAAWYVQYMTEPHPPRQPMA